jgi:hypothetical protein
MFKIEKQTGHGRGCAYDASINHAPVEIMRIMDQHQAKPY